MDTAVAALESASSPIIWSLRLSLMLAAGLHLVAHIAPSIMVHFNAVPWAFQLRRSTNLRYQALLYGALHTHGWARCRTAASPGTRSFGSRYSVRCTRLPLS